MRYFRTVFVTLLAIVLIAPAFAQEPNVIPVPRDQRPSLTEQAWGLTLVGAWSNGKTIWLYKGTCRMVKDPDQRVQDVALVTAAMCQTSTTPNA